MAEDNVEIMRRALVALHNEGVEGLLEFIDPEFETTTSPDLASEPDTYRGHDGLRRYFDSFYEAMKDIWFEGREYIPFGDRVVVDVCLHATGRSTGIKATQDMFMVWTLRDGQGIKVEAFVDRADAVAAAEA